MMIPALRLTILLLCCPAAGAFATQVTPPVAPRTPVPKVPREVEPPRAPLLAPTPHDPWLERPIPKDWSDFDLSMRGGHLEAPEFRFEMPRAHFETPSWNVKVPSVSVVPDVPPIAMHAWTATPSLGDGRWGHESFATSPRAPWLQGDPADSLYKAAYELLNRGEWRRAATGFGNIPQRFPNSGYAADALYWQAFALYRIGGTEDLQAALRSLETMQAKYPRARTQSDAEALMARIRGTLAARGDREAASKLRSMMSEQGQRCDREDQAVRSEALKALAQTDPASLSTSVRRVLAKKDACSAPLRRTAVYLLGNSGDSEAPTILRDVALTDSEPEVKTTALQYLARSPSDVAVSALEEVLRTSTDQSVLRTAARGLATNPNPRARQAVRTLIERSDAPERLRIEAVSGFENPERTSDDDAAWLRSVYGKIDNPRVKARIARVLGQRGGEQNDQWLLSLMRNNDEPVEVRTAALQRVASRNMPIADAVKLYATVADRQLREQLINVYAQRREPEATDKLIDIVKNDTDYNLRRQAINALTRKNDPRATKLLLEIIDK